MSYSDYPSRGALSLVDDVYVDVEGRRVRIARGPGYYLHCPRCPMSFQFADQCKDHVRNCSRVTQRFYDENRTSRCNGNRTSRYNDERYHPAESLRAHRGQRFPEPWVPKQPRGFDPQREAEYEERHRQSTSTRYDSRYGGLRGWEPSTSPPPLQFPIRRTVWPSAPVKDELESPTLPPMCLPATFQANTFTDMMTAVPDCSATRATTPVAVAPYRHLSRELNASISSLQALLSTVQPTEPDQNPLERASSVHAIDGCNTAPEPPLIQSTCSFFASPGETGIPASVPMPCVSESAGGEDAVRQFLEALGRPMPHHLKTLEALTIMSAQDLDLLASTPDLEILRQELQASGFNIMEWLYFKRGLEQWAQRNASSSVTI